MADACRNGQNLMPVLVDAVKDYVKASLARHKVPRDVHFLDALTTVATNGDAALRAIDGQDRCKIAIQSNNVETDDAATSMWSTAPAPGCTFWS